MVGIDIGSFSVKVLEFTSTKSGSEIKGLARKELPREMRNDDPDALSGLIKDCLEEGNISTRDVVIMVSGPQVFIRRITMPPMPQEELAEVIPFEATKHISFPVEQLAVDYVIVGEKEMGGVKNQDILIVAIPNELVEKEVSIVRAAGLNPVAVTVSPMVLWKAFLLRGKTPDGNVVAMLDMGFERTTISLLNDGVLEFARTINVSGDEVTKSLMTTPMIKGEDGARPLTYDESERIKQEHGFPPPVETGTTKEGIPLNRISMLMGPVMEKLLGEVRVSLDFYLNEFQVPRVDKIILSGGGAAMKGLREFMAGNLGIEVELADPFQGINFAENVPRDGSLGVDSAFVVPLGLAAWSEGDLSLIRKKKKVSGRGAFAPVMFLAVPSCVAAIVIVILASIASGKLADSRAELDRKKVELASLSPAAEKALKLGSKKKKLEAEMNSFPREFRKSIDPSRILEEIRLSAPDNTRLERIVVVPKKKKKIIEIWGSAFFLDQRGSAMSDFMTALENSPLFDDVRMISMEAKKKEKNYAVDGLRFLINCKYSFTGG